MSKIVYVASKERKCRQYELEGFILYEGSKCTLQAFLAQSQTLVYAASQERKCRRYKLEGFIMYEGSECTLQAFLAQSQSTLLAEKENVVGMS